MTTESRLDDGPAETTPEEPEGDGPAAGPGRPRWRRIAGWVLTALACVLVLFALIAPNDFNRFSAGAFLRIPVEGLVGVGLLLVLPGRTRRIVAVTAGAILGLLTILKIFDLGFFATLYRPFDPVLDWTFLEAGVDYIAVTSGGFAAVAAVVAAVVLVIALPVLMALAALRLTRILHRHRMVSAGAAAGLGAVWVILAVVGAQFVSGLPVASTSAAEYAYVHGRQVPDGIRDAREFDKEVTVDAFRDTPGEQLLTALRGKDVVLVFFESYGRSAIERPELAGAIGPVVDEGTARLRTAGFGSRSAFLTSSTVGGGSWLAHATLDSGLWIDNQRRYRNLVTTDRFTLPRAFQRAGWRTVGVEPAVIQAWPEGAFFGYDQIYVAESLAYQGTRFSYATMPDQYILSAFQRFERSRPHAPVMAQIVTLTSHAPWSPVPERIDWEDVGDGRIFDTMGGTDAPPESIFSRDTARVRADYTRAIRYTLDTVVSYVETYGDDNLVVVLLGDHEPAPVVTGENAGRDVPVSIISRDPAVLDRVGRQGWQEGLRPDPRAPVWRMDTFRDRFLTAYGPRSG